MKHALFLLILILVLSGCRVDDPMNGPKSIHFRVVELPDSLPVDSIPCTLVENHLIAFSPVAMGYTNDEGCCTLNYDYTYERFISYSAEVEYQQGRQSVIYRGLTESKGYYRETQKTALLNLERASDFQVLSVLEPLGTLQIIYRFERQDFDWIQVRIYEQNTLRHSHRLSPGVSTDTMTFPCSALEPIRIVYSIIKANKTLSVGSDTCRIPKFATICQEVVLK